MNKSKFLESLERELKILHEDERKDIIDEYSLHIDQEIEKGLTEEQAVENFGNINELATEILAAYKVDSQIMNKGRNIIEKTVNAIERLMKSVSDMIKSLPKGKNFGNKSIIYVIYLSFWGIVLAMEIAVYNLVGKVLSFLLGGFGVFILVITIILVSILMLIILIEITIHVFKREK